MPSAAPDWQIKREPECRPFFGRSTGKQAAWILLFLLKREPSEVRHWLLQFKGVGPKTASIVMQFSLRQPAFPVDTHIYRVSGRLGLRPSKLSVEKTHLWMEELFLAEQYGPAHLNIIRLGREICHARNPDCLHCPLKRNCFFYRQTPTVIK